MSIYLSLENNFLQNKLQIARSKKKKKKKKKRLHQLCHQDGIKSAASSKCSPRSRYVFISRSSSLVNGTSEIARAFKNLVQKKIALVASVTSLQSVR